MYSTWCWQWILEICKGIQDNMKTVTRDKDRILRFKVLREKYYVWESEPCMEICWLGCGMRKAWEAPCVNLFRQVDNLINTPSTLYNSTFATNFWKSHCLSYPRASMRCMRPYIWSVAWYLQGTPVVSKCEKFFLVMCQTLPQYSLFLGLWISSKLCLLWTSPYEWAWYRKLWVHTLCCHFSCVDTEAFNFEEK